MFSSTFSFIFFVYSFRVCTMRILETLARLCASRIGPVVTIKSSEWASEKNELFAAVMTITLFVYDRQQQRIHTMRLLVAPLVLVSRCWWLCEGSVCVLECASSSHGEQLIKNENLKTNKKPNYCRLDLNLILISNVLCNAKRLERRHDINILTHIKTHRVYRKVLSLSSRMCVTSDSSTFVYIFKIPVQQLPLCNPHTL